MSKTACITGITGQTGSYLAETLLDKGFIVYGLIRRSSSFNTERIDHIYANPNLKLAYGDLSDYGSVLSFIGDVKPDLFFNLGAQSHVKVSFDIPEYTFDITGTGALRCLEAIRKASPETRFLGAASSELFGNSPPPQNELTPFRPRSPYACAKATAFYTTVNYREAYGIFAVNSISFNHECIASNTPLIIKRDGILDVITPLDLISLRRKGPNIQHFEKDNIFIWDGKDWTKIKLITATKINKQNKEHKLISIQSRAGNISVTKHHHMLKNNYEIIKADELKVGDNIQLFDNIHTIPRDAIVNKEFAELLGYLVSEGYVSDNTMRITNKDMKMLNRAGEIWYKLFLGTSHYSNGRSGFPPYNIIPNICLNGNKNLTRWIKEQIYTKDGLKKIPAIILNSSLEIQKIFLDAYYEGDGLKATSLESFVTNSPVLAQGLILLYSFLGKKCSTYLETRENRINKYYRVNIIKNNGQGSHLIKSPNEIMHIKEEQEKDEEWVFDLETDSGVFAAGVGRIVVHNSPSRGETFVTRKITRAATRIKVGIQKKLYLGNLEAKRDWNHAKDIVNGMILMIEADEPDDFVIASGQMHSVKEFAEITFSKLGLDYKDYVEFDPKYLRPAEVPALCGDYSKIKSKLGWEPKISFEQLIDEMVNHDMELAKWEKVRGKKF